MFKLIDNSIMILINLLICFTLTESQTQNLNEKFQIWSQHKFHNYTFKTIIRIMEMLSDRYDITLHFDNITMFNVDKTIKYTREEASGNLPMSTKVTTINYDKFGPENPIAIPQSTRNVAHMILLEEPREFVRYMNRNKKATDVAIFLCLRQSQQRNTCKTNLENDGSLKVSSFLHEAYANTIFRVFVLDFLDDKGRFYWTCYYCGIYSFTLRLGFEENILDDDIPSNMIRYLRWQLKHTFRNLEGQSLKLAFIDDDIYFICVNKTDVKREEDVLTLCDRLEGIQGKMLTELSKIMNFTFQLVTPFIDIDTPWFNAILSANESKVEWSVGSITVTDRRNKMVTFSISFGSDPLRYLYAVPEHDFFQSLENVTAFGLFAWIMILITIIVLASVLILHILYEQKQQQVFQIRNIFTKNIWMISTSLLEQSLSEVHTIDGRSLIAPWLLCALIISSAYKGKLSSMIINPLQPDILTLDQLARDGYTPFLDSRDSTYVVALLKSSNDNTYKALYSRYRDDIDLCQVLNKAMVSKSFLINEQNIILYITNKRCAARMQYHELMRLRFPTNNFYPSNIAWPFRNRSPLRSTVNRHLMRMVQSGLYLKWTEMYLKVYTGDPIKVNHSKAKRGKIVNDLNTFLPIFLLWIIGIIVSILVFILEFILFKLRRVELE